MSKIKVQSPSSGTAVFTLTTASGTTTDRTITLPDSSVTLGAATPSITDNGNANAITIDSSENVGIGVTPESSYPNRPVLRIGAGLGLLGYATGNPSHSWINSNSYQDPSTADDKYIGTDQASQIRQANGAFEFKVAPNSWDGVDGSATHAISWTTSLQLTNDGRGLSQFTAKAWVNWSSTAINDSHNVSSASDGGTGQYTFNYTNNLANTNYAIVASTHKGGGAGSATNSCALSVGEAKNVNSFLVEAFRADLTTRKDAPVLTMVFGD